MRSLATRNLSVLAVRAALLDGKGNVRLEPRHELRVRPGEALVRVLRAGICSTDQELARGYMGFQGVPGHEFVGRVEQAPPGHEQLLGRRVVGEINAACGECGLCRDDLGRHCPKRTVLGILGRDGAMAELLSLPPGNLHPVPDGLSTDRALFTEPVAAAFEVLEQVSAAGRAVLVMGDGKLGTLVARVLALAGARVTVLGRHERKLAALAADGLATTAAAESLPARSFELVVEATGSPEGFEQALALLRPRGTLVLKTTCAQPRPLNLAPVVIDEVTVVGSRCGPFLPALAALAAGRLAPEQSVDASFPLDEVAAAFCRAAMPGVRKVVLNVAD